MGDERPCAQDGAGQLQQQAAPRMTAREASVRLASLMSRELGIGNDPAMLRLFIKAYWSRVSLYAHAIHDEE